MATKLYVGNLAYAIDDSALKSTFEKIGAVKSAVVIMDRETGRSKGFGFVEMSEADCAAAITGLNGVEVQGRALTVNEARDRAKPERSGAGRERGYR